MLDFEARKANWDSKWIFHAHNYKDNTFKAKVLKFMIWYEEISSFALPNQIWNHTVEVYLLEYYQT